MVRVIKFLTIFIIMSLNVNIIYAEYDTKDNLLSAIVSNDETAVRKYLSDPINVQKELNPECPPSTICKPISFAVRKSNIQIISLLIDAGADINAANGFSGDTPLIIAISNNRRDVVKFLIEKGADINKANKFGITPFWGLCAMGDFELVHLLITKGANINFTGRMQERSPGKQQFVYGVTPLMISVKNGYLDITNLLLKNGADIKLKDSLGRSALDYARLTGNPDMIKIFKNK